MNIKYIMKTTHGILLRKRNQNVRRQNKKATIMFKNFLSEKRVVYEIMGKI